MTIRTFAYLDEERVRSGLAQVMGAQPVRGKQVTATGGKKSASVALNVGAAQAGAGLGKDSSRSDELETEITPDAAFQQLYSRLADSGDIQALDAFDAAIWRQITKGEVIEAEVSVEVFSVDLALDNARALGGMAGAIEPFMALMPDVDAKTRQMFDTIKAVSSGSRADAPVPIICRPVGTAGYTFLCHLARKFIRTASLTELEGEWTILGAVRRIIARGETHPIPAGITGREFGTPPNRATRRAAAKNDADGTFTVRGPGAILVPYAIYV